MSGGATTGSSGTSGTSGHDGCPEQLNPQAGGGTGRADDVAPSGS